MKNYIIQNKKEEYLRVLPSKTRCWTGEKINATLFNEKQLEKLPKKIKIKVTEVAVVLDKFSKKDKDRQIATAEPRNDVKEKSVN